VAYFLGHPVRLYTETLNFASTSYIGLKLRPEQDEYFNKFHRYKRFTTNLLQFGHGKMRHRLVFELSLSEE